MCIQYPQRPEEGVGSPGTGVIDSTLQGLQKEKPVDCFSPLVVCIKTSSTMKVSQ